MDVTLEEDRVGITGGFRWPGKGKRGTRRWIEVAWRRIALLTLQIRLSVKFSVLHGYLLHYSTLNKLEGSITLPLLW